ncbi:hypothetical protein NCAS_0A01580 [Naumovozyma castellii]|uniref:Mediator of RNA polymerase II transcription subunit 6 n=1 Tax=Naumovozyma castellii TaxID=27288 RepID=G0V5I0_NAUCA|nr:hypothetical protein NCAS_0A01580 [Naumovozyma castellii CBS 4309]CCC66716.1 hypothetical protein NCAS_0A01580 [Naumovozyma castellii CBS 4309]
MNTPLDELQWKSPEWIQAFGLRTDNVLDYFSESPFFEKTSNNHVIKMQRQFSQDPAQQSAAEQGQEFIPTGTNPTASTLLNTDDFSYLNKDPIRKDLLGKYPLHFVLEQELKKLKGIEYVLSNVREPDFWQIRKQYRSQPGNKIETLQNYYIIGANVYQSPTIFKVVQSRLLSSTLHLSKTLDDIYKLTEFKPSQGMQFIKPPMAPTTSNTSNATSNNPATTTAGNVSRSSGPPTMVMGGGPQPSGGAGGLHTGTMGAVSTSQYDNSLNERNNQDSISKEMMNKLILTSIKSTPEYI